MPTPARALLPALAPAALLLCAAAARAAQPTDVADAMVEDHPVEVDVEVRFTHLKKDVRITRENLQTDPVTQARGIALVDELNHQQTVDRFDFHLAVGLYKDLEVHATVPLTLADTQSWGYAEVNGTSVEATSTLRNNRLDISGCSRAAPANACDPNAAARPILPGVGQSRRAGVGDPTFGLAWAPLHEAREEHLPAGLYPPGHDIASWVVGFDYTLPLPGDPDDPSKFGFDAATTPGGAAPATRPLLRKAHVFSPWTAFSKRFKVLDPYFVLRARLPLVSRGAAAGDGASDNCWHPERLADVATANCVAAAWQGQTGYQPAFTGTFTVGTELVAAETPKGDQKFALDLHVDTTWTSQGRDYSEVADALGKLTFTEEHVSFTGSLGLYGRAARWLHFRVAGTLGVDTPHLLTSEPVGKDIDGNGAIVISGGAANRSPEQNPTYDFRLDQVGRRLRAETAIVWGVSGVLSLNF